MMLRACRVLIAFVSAGIFVTAAEPEQLHERSIDLPNECGKPLKMRFEEIERAPHYSIIRVTHESGASVPSIMFVTRGMWEIARIRGTPFFITLKEWLDEDDRWMYKVGFAPNDKVDIASYFKEPAPAELKYSSVKEFEPIFGK